MKKSKLVLAGVLALILCILCVSVPTFSWYTRPQELTGKNLAWDDNALYAVSDGNNVSMQTFESSDGGVTYSETAAEISNSMYTIANDSRKCFRTDITNTGASDQSVSLFISSIDNASSDVYIGVNDPLKSHKSIPADFTGNVTANTGTYRLYFNNSTWSANDSTGYIVRYSTTTDEPNTSSPSVKMTATSGNDGYGHTVFYAEIPTDAKRFYVAYDNGTDNTKTGVFADFRKEGFTQSSSIRMWPDSNTDGYSKMNVTGANISDYYETIYLTKGSTFNIGLSNYAANSTSYTVDSGSTSVISISSTTLTAKTVGTGWFTTTATSQYGDTDVVHTKVVVSDATGATTSSDVPVVTNIKVKAHNEDGDGIVSVYWYLENKTGASKTFTISDIYLSL